MKFKQRIQTLVLGSDRDKPIPESFNGKFLYHVRYHYLMLLGLNVLFMVCCLPIVTIPAACCAMSGILTKLVREKPVFFWNDYWMEFKTDFLKRCVLWLLMAIAPFSLGFYTTWLGLDRDGTVTRLICIVVLFLVQSFWFTCMVLIDTTPLKNLKNALILMALEWKKSLMVLGSAGVLCGVCFLFPLYGFPVMILCLFSLSTLMISIVLTEPILERLGRNENPRCDYENDP